MTEKQRRTIFIITFSVLLVFTLGLVWGNSVRNADKSENQSSAVYEEVKSATTKVVGEDRAEEIFSCFTLKDFRKLAHVAEYFVLAIEVACLFCVIFGAKKSTLKYLPVSILTGVFTAVVDETIQIFSNRGSSVADVWVDTSGYVLGTLVATAIIAIAVSVMKKREKARE